VVIVAIAVVVDDVRTALVNGLVAATDALVSGIDDALSANALVGSAVEGDTLVAVVLALVEVCVAVNDVAVKVVKPLLIVVFDSPNGVRVSVTEEVVELCVVMMLV
jgi:hypothetical protein